MTLLADAPVLAEASGMLGLHLSVQSDPDLGCVIVDLATTADMGGAVQITLSPAAANALAMRLIEAAAELGD